MKNLGKALLSTGGAAMLALCTSCVAPFDDAQGKEPPKPVAPRDGLASVDMCSILTPEELRTLGLEGPGEPVANIPTEPGCDYHGEAYDVALYKNQQQTVQSYSKSSSWAHFDRVSVDERAGAQAIENGSVGADLYNTMFDAGGGVVIVTVQEFKGKIDERAESLKLAERIAPRLPR